MDFIFDRWFIEAVAYIGIGLVIMLAVCWAVNQIEGKE